MAFTEGISPASKPRKMNVPRIVSAETKLIWKLATETESGGLLRCCMTPRITAARQSPAKPEITVKTAPSQSTCTMMSRGFAPIALRMPIS